MCGIIAYKGTVNDGALVVLKGLQNLEYRGYDSWGIACADGSAISVSKEIGKIGGVTRENLTLSESTCAIGHTRWATHGEVNLKNAHPHLSTDKSVAVVHNGIVENFQELRDELKEKGFTFQSDTDTEVIPQHIVHLMQQGNDFETAVKETLKRLEGCFAVVAIHMANDMMIGGRRGSPLVLGLGEGEHFLASDVPAFLEYTNQVQYLEDDEVVVISDGSVVVSDLMTNSAVEKKTSTIEWSVEQAQKGSYPHFMVKEIHEQAHTIEQAINQDPAHMEKCVELLKNARGIFFVGCGTSYHACVSASYIFSHVAKCHVNVVLGSEFRNYKEFLTEDTLFVAVSQSGETADLLDAIKIAKEKGVTIMSIVNVMGSTIMRVSDETLLMNAGPEICVLSTKSYTSQLSVLLSLCYGMVGKENEARELIRGVQKEITSQDDAFDANIQAIAKKIKDAEHMFLIGRDLAYPSAIEGALKIKEVSYIHAEGFAGGELKHGTIALIEKGTPVVVLGTDATRSMILSNAMEIKARGGYLIGIDSVENELFDEFIKVEEHTNANPIAMILPIQLLAYYLALERGCDPDKPRNLAKSVTVK